VGPQSQSGSGGKSGRNFSIINILRVHTAGILPRSRIYSALTVKRVSTLNCSTLLNMWDALGLNLRLETG
jgi:hypothetical protein